MRALPCRPGFVIACAALVAASCAGPPVSVQATTAPRVNLSQYRTFAFFTPPYRRELPETIAEQEVRSSLARDLTQKGMTEVQPGAAPDFLVVFHTRMQLVTDANSVGYGTYEAWPDLRTYQQGTLVVDFVDPRAHRVFWRGTARAAVAHPSTPDLARIDRAVSKLLQRYPALTAGAPPRSL